MTSPEYQAPTWVNEDDPDFIEGVSPDLGAGYLNQLSGAVEDHGQRLGAITPVVTNLQNTALDQAAGDNRYILQSNADGFAPAEATATALAGLPFRADNVTTTGAAVGKVVAATAVSGGAPTAFGLVDHTQVSVDGAPIATVDIDSTAVTPSDIGAATATHTHARRGPLLPTWQPSRYYPPTVPGAATATQTTNLNVLRVAALVVPNTVTLASLVVEVTTLAAGGLHRPVIYADDGAGRPGALFLDAGTVDCSTVGFKVADFADISIPAGDYWVGSISQGTADPTIRCLTGQALGLGIDSASASLFIGYRADGVTGAAPANFPSPGTSYASNVARVLAVTAA